MIKLNKSVIIACLIILLTTIFVACSSNSDIELDYTEETLSTEITSTISEGETEINLTEVEDDNLTTTTNNHEEETTSTTKTTITTTTKKAVTTIKSKTTTQAIAETKTITVNEALNILQEFYGNTFTVNATINEDGYQYFAVYDKNSEKYASIKVNLSTSEATETIVKTGEKNEYTLSD